MAREFTFWYRCLFFKEKCTATGIDDARIIKASARLVNFKEYLFEIAHGKGVEMLYQKILVPLDGSEFSECALEDVKAITKGCSVPFVELLSIVQMPSEDKVYGYPEIFRREDLEKVVSQANEYLTRIGKRLQ